MTTASESKPIKILLLRSYSKAPFSIKAAMAINKCDSVQFMQYPLWPTHHSYQNEIYKFHKMGLDEKVLNEINKNVITSYNDLQKRLENHYFDFCIINRSRCYSF